MIPHDTLKRIWDTFVAHDNSINRKYEAFRKENQYWSSDRDRLVGRFFAKYAGRYIVLADREILGTMQGNFSFRCDRKSLFSPDIPDIPRSATRESLVPLTMRATIPCPSKRLRNAEFAASNTGPFPSNIGVIVKSVINI